MERKTESVDTEFKEKYVADIKKTVVAFANTQGGNIYIGRADDGSIVGVDHPDEVMLQAVNAVRSAIKPDITMFTDFSVVTIDGKAIVKVSVQRGADRPYYLAEKGLKPGGVFVRQGSSSAPASEAAIRHMIKETDGDSYENARSFNQELSFDTLEQEMLMRFIDLGPAQMQTLGIKNSDGLYTNLGLLLSDQCLHTIKAAYFEGNDKIIFKDRKEFGGSLLQQLADCYHYLDIFNRTRASISGLYRIDEQDYPPEAVREALINAIVHREYSLSGSILVNIYEDRIEITSLGGLVPGVSLEAIRVGVSQSRNERLANVFYRMRLIEAYGTGITKIISCYRGQKVQPRFIAVDGAFQVVLPNRHFVAETLPEMVQESAYRAARPMKKQHQQVLTQLLLSGSITRQEIQQLLEVGQSRAINIINEMLSLNLIVAEGKGRNTVYRAQSS